MNKKIGEPVNNVHIRNPLAVAIVNARAQRDQICAATAGALLILETQNQPDKSNPESGGRQAKKRQSFLDEVIEK